LCGRERGPQEQIKKGHGYREMLLVRGEGCSSSILGERRNNRFSRGNKGENKRNHPLHGKKKNGHLRGGESWQVLSQRIRIRNLAGGLLNAYRRGKHFGKKKRTKWENYRGRNQGLQLALNERGVEHRSVQEKVDPKESRGRQNG